MERLAHAPQNQRSYYIKRITHLYSIFTSLIKGQPELGAPLFVEDYETLRRDKNPIFDHCKAKYWLASQDGKRVGRIAGCAKKSLAFLAG